MRRALLGRGVEEILKSSDIFLIEKDNPTTCAGFREDSPFCISLCWLGRDQP